MLPNEDIPMSMTLGVTSVETSFARPDKAANSFFFKRLLGFRAKPAERPADAKEIAQSILKDKERGLFGKSMAVMFGLLPAERQIRTDFETLLLQQCEKYEAKVETRAKGLSAVGVVTLSEREACELLSDIDPALGEKLLDSFDGHPSEAPYTLEFGASSRMEKTEDGKELKGSVTVTFNHAEGVPRTFSLGSASDAGRQNIIAEAFHDKECGLLREAMAKAFANQGEEKKYKAFVKGDHAYELALVGKLVRKVAIGVSTLGLAGIVAHYEETKDVARTIFEYAVNSAEIDKTLGFGVDAEAAARLGVDISPPEITPLLPVEDFKEIAAFAQNIDEESMELLKGLGVDSFSIKEAVQYADPEEYGKYLEGEVARLVSGGMDRESAVRFYEESMEQHKAVLASLKEYMDYGNTAIVQNAIEANDLAENPQAYASAVQDLMDQGVPLSTAKDNIDAFIAENSRPLGEAIDLAKQEAVPTLSEAFQNPETWALKVGPDGTLDLVKAEDGFSVNVAPDGSTVITGEVGEAYDEAVAMITQEQGVTPGEARELLDQFIAESAQPDILPGAGTASVHYDANDMREALAAQGTTTPRSQIGAIVHYGASMAKTMFADPTVLMNTAKTLAHGAVCGMIAGSSIMTLKRICDPENFRHRDAQKYAAMFNEKPRQAQNAGMRM